MSVPLRYKGEKTWGQVKAALDGLDWESVSSMAEHRNALIEMWSEANHGRVTQANQCELEVQLVDLRDHLSAAYENTITTEYNPYIDTYKGVKVPDWSQVVSRLGCPNILEHLATVIDSVDPSHKMLKRSLPEMCSLILWNPQEILKERAKELHALQHGALRRELAIKRNDSGSKKVHKPSNPAQSAQIREEMRQVKFEISKTDNPKKKAKKRPASRSKSNNPAPVDPKYEAARKRNCIKSALARKRRAAIKQHAVDPLDNPLH